MANKNSSLSSNSSPSSLPFHYPPSGLPLFWLPLLVLERQMSGTRWSAKADYLWKATYTHLLNPTLHQHLQIFSSPHLWHHQLCPTHSEAAWHYFILSKLSSVSSVLHFTVNISHSCDDAPLSLPWLIFHHLYGQLPSLTLMILPHSLSIHLSSPTAWNCSQCNTS